MVKKNAQKLMDSIISADVTTVQKLALVIIALSSVDGECVMSATKLSELCGICKASSYRVIKQLESKGLLVVVKRTCEVTNANLANKYVLTV